MAATASAQRAHTATVMQLAAAARALLLAHRWPGNLRKRRNALDCARSVCSHGLIDPADLLLQHLRGAPWRVAAIARQRVGARMTLYRRRARWGIRAPNARGGGLPAH